MKDFENILLEKDQEDLLAMIVEAARNVPREQRDKFLAIHLEESSQHLIRHQGLPNETRANLGDIETLAREGLLALTYGNDRTSANFDVTPLGFRYYEYLKQHSGQPSQRIEIQSRNYLNSDYFQRKYPEAYKKWANAETMLWASDSEQQLTTIGHLCREALQEFATSLVDQYKPPNIDQDKKHTGTRVTAVLDSQSDKLGKKLKAFLVALLAYWGTVNDLVQRQEHGAQKEGQRLVWEDARLVVFQSIIVMYEIGNALDRSKR
jgi:hypothetical protein